MVVSSLADPRSAELQARCLTDNPAANSMLLGCVGCPQFRECGGLFVEEEMFDCLSLCCGGGKNCTQVCPNDAERFVWQKREVGGFDLHNTPRAPALGYVSNVDVAELVYHGSKRANALAIDVVALRLADLVDFRHASPKYVTKDAVCEAFKISKAARLIVSGVDHDNRIEPWWSLGGARREIIQALRLIGIELVTAPNFSLVIDVPRADNLHSMKRMALTFAEFQQGGMPCALHPNGRTERDFEKWAKFVAERPEVEVLSYEFITGPGLKSRKQFHLDMLASIAKAAGRPIDLVVRGDPHVVPFLMEHFRNVTYIDTTAFVKTMKRREAERVANHLLDWNAVPTKRGEMLDERLQHNVEEQHAFLRNVYFGGEVAQSKAA